MIITINKTVGNKTYNFQINESDFFDAYKMAACIDLLPSKCGVCGKTDLSLTFRKPKGFNYPGIRCNDCGAAASIKGKRDGSEYFIEPMEVYQAEGDNQNANGQQNAIQNQSQDGGVSQAQQVFNGQESDLRRTMF